MLRKRQHCPETFSEQLWEIRGYFGRFRIICSILMTEYTFCLLFVERIVVTGMSGCGGRELMGR